MAAVMAKASMTRATWRCQPCQERVSLWSRRSEEHTSELQSHRDLHSFPTRRSSDLEVGVMSDGGGHGEGQHDQSDVAMPAVPGAGLVVVEAEFVLGGLEAVFDGPAVAFDLD